RNIVIELAAAEGIPTHEVPITKHDVYIADECFLTGTAAEVIPVVKVDARGIADGRVGPIAKQLKERFSEYARGA
ncbi:MAG: aminotransferase class IV, partial [Planctomycetota bacterium]